MDNVPPNFEARLKSLRQRLRTLYLETGRDLELSERIDDLTQNAADCQEGFGDKRRALIVVGNTNSGKTWSLDRQFATRPEFQPRLDTAGKLVDPLLRIDVPQRCTSKDLCLFLFRKLGLPSKNRRTTEAVLYSDLEHLLAECGKLYIYIDEAQQLQRSNTSFALQAAQDGLKRMMEFKDHPVHLILSGVAPLDQLLEGDGQIGSRSYPLRFEALEVPGDEQWILDALQKVAIDACGLTLSKEVHHGDFTNRLNRSANGAYGSIVSAVKTASIRAISKQRQELTLNDFASHFRKITGCDDDLNIFHTKYFEELTLAIVLARLRKPVAK